MCVCACVFNCLAAKLFIGKFSISYGMNLDDHRVSSLMMKGGGGGSGGHGLMGSYEVHSTLHLVRPS